MHRKQPFLIEAIKVVVFLSLSLGGLFALSKPWGQVPAMGPLLSPFSGLWVRSHSPFDSNARADHFILHGLKGQVSIQVDEDGIQHVFAQEDEDLYFAQGWIHAAERLWQMEFLTRLAEGRLSELVGRRALEFDRMFLRMGIPEAAKESAELMLQDAVTDTALRSYASGVNAYISSLRPRDLPFEFRLLSATPEKWSPEKAALLLKLMAYNLSGRSADPEMTRSRSVLSKPDFEELFPVKPDVADTIIPKGTKWSFSGTRVAPPADEFIAQLKPRTRRRQPDPSNGSNNWAISGRKSTTGLPILSNDIHLEYSLPSLWFEMQLVSKTQNVYGISLPGAPGIILGFNKNLAWGVTSGSTDVLDWYQIRYRDGRRSEYLFDGNWRPVLSREKLIGVRGEQPVPIRLRRTHFGPVVFEDDEIPANGASPRDLSIQWTALLPSNELKSFLLLNKADNVEGCKNAIEAFHNPAQNFLCADNSGHIGLWHRGRFPVRWKGQGRLVGDGSSRSYEWQGWIPPHEVPAAKDPSRGFLSSANQMPVDDQYPYYLGTEFESPYRATRINELLAEKAKLSPQDFIEMQSDTMALPARELLPVLLKAMESENAQRAFAEAKGDPALAREALAQLKAWNLHFSEDSVGATIFNTWFWQLHQTVWAAHFPNGEDYLYPKTPVLIQLAKEKPNSKWFDDPETPEHEALENMAARSFAEALKQMEHKTGSKRIADWKWGEFSPTEFPHLSRLPGLGSGKFSAAGASYDVFANKGNHGPVWKLVVALGPKPKAWAIYPGGQSGDPTSPNYDNFLKTWKNGTLKEVNYLDGSSGSNQKAYKQIRLTPHTASQEVSR